jgi:FkbM family methyltransferase
MEYMKFLRKATFESVSVSLPNYQLAHQQNWDREKKIIKKKYDLCGEWHCPEIFYFHHGLRFTNKRVLDYVRGRDMIDCGAFIGDSLLIMREYTDKTVYCYEFSKKNIEKFFKVIKNNNITSGFALISKALGESVRRINYYEPGVVSSGISLTTGGDATVEMTTVDAEVKKHNITVGFIKIDVEGYGMPVIRGAIETIKSQRPVLSIGVYHNHEELFHIKPFLQENLTDYVFEFHLQQFTAGDFNELILLCYPKELASND